MSREKDPQNIEYPRLISFLCGFFFGLNINKDRALLKRQTSVTTLSLSFFPYLTVVDLAGGSGPNPISFEVLVEIKIRDLKWLECFVKISNLLISPYDRVFFKVVSVFIK